MTCKIIPLIDHVSFFIALVHKQLHVFFTVYFIIPCTLYTLAIYNFFPDVQVFYSLKA